jgi:hypothetical protein
MKCITKLYRECHIVKVACEILQDKERCSEFVSLYLRPEFLRSYCAFCIKAVYARRFKVVKYSVVNTL